LCRAIPGRADLPRLWLLGRAYLLAADPRSRHGALDRRPHPVRCRCGEGLSARGGGARSNPPHPDPYQHLRRGLDHRLALTTEILPRPQGDDTRLSDQIRPVQRWPSWSLAAHDGLARNHQLDAVRSRRTAAIGGGFMPRLENKRAFVTAAGAGIG